MRLSGISTAEGAFLYAGASPIRPGGVGVHVAVQLRRLYALPRAVDAGRRPPSRNPPARAASKEATTDTQRDGDSKFRGERASNVFEATSKGTTLDPQDEWSAAAARCGCARARGPPTTLEPACPRRPARDARPSPNASRASNNLVHPTSTPFERPTAGDEAGFLLPGDSRDAVPTMGPGLPHPLPRTLTEITPCHRWADSSACTYTSSRASSGTKTTYVCCLHAPRLRLPLWSVASIHASGPRSTLVGCSRSSPPPRRHRKIAPRSQQRLHAALSGRPTTRCACPTGARPHHRARANEESGNLAKRVPKESERLLRVRVPTRAIVQM